MRPVTVRSAHCSALSVERTKERKQQDLLPITLTGELEAGLVGFYVNPNSQGLYLFCDERSIAGEVEGA